MAEGIVSFGVEKLWELLIRESERLNGIDEQVVGLKRQLRRLQSLLEDANGKKHESKRVRNFLEDVQDIVYDAEDVIESFVLKESRGEEKGIKKHVKRFSCFLVDRRSFATDIEGITKRISEVIEEMQSFGIQQIIDGGGCSLSLQERQRDLREIRQTFSNDHESDLVGVEKSVEELVGRLVENDNNFQVVSITGMGGIGKTSLARQVFRHSSVRRHFDGFAWVCVSQDFTQKHIWERILQDLKIHDDGDISRMDEHTLQDPTCFVFRPKILTPEECWNLCQRIVFPMRDETEFRVDDKLEAIGKKMVTHCGGLPLAVKVLGGLLAKKHTLREWERVHHNIGSQIVRGTTSGIVDDNYLNSVNRVLSLSYEDLPMQLKHCFLYLAHYPEDYDIEMADLFSCWAAEGMIMSCYGGSTIREIGKSYMEELVRRNMVIFRIKNEYSSNQSCQMHDMMREVCLSKAKEENFLQVIKFPTPTFTINYQSPSRSPRLVVHSDIAFQLLGYKSNLKVRSLICFKLGGEDLWIKSAQWFRSLPLLRVLDLSNVSFKGGKLPSSIGELIHLRFLSLENAVVSHIPSTLRNLKLLLHLNLSNDGHEVHVPNVLKEMLELRYLKLPQFMDNATNLELGDLMNLETLWGFSTEHSCVTDLLYMTKLMFLGVQLNYGLTSKALLSSLCKLRNLEELSLFSEFDHGGELVLNFVHLKDLMLGMRMPRFLDQHRFPPHLAHIYLLDCNIEKDPMPILEKFLHLKSIILLRNAFTGRRMVCSKGGFPQLCALWITGQVMLEEWIVEEGSMPCLDTLTVDNCKKLKELPCGLKYITSLKELQIIKMKEEWMEKLVPGGEDYYKVQLIPNVQFFNCEE